MINRLHCIMIVRLRYILHQTLFFHERTKPVEIDCTIWTEYVMTKTQPAALMTKAFDSYKFKSFLVKLDVRYLHAPT